MQLNLVPITSGLALFGIILLVSESTVAKSPDPMTVAKKLRFTMKRYYSTIELRKEFVVVIQDPSFQNDMTFDRNSGYGEGTIQCLAQVNKKSTIKEMIVLYGTLNLATSRLLSLRTNMSSANFMALLNAVKTDFSKIVFLKRQQMKLAKTLCLGKNSADDGILGAQEQAFNSLHMVNPSQPL